jgi:hypothetical protein
LESDDLNSIVEHIQLCQRESQEIRWDWIETRFFPEPESSSRHLHPKELRCSDLRSLDSEITSSDIDSFAEHSYQHEDSFAYRTSPLHARTAEPSILQARTSAKLTRRESYQQAILDLVYEPLEAKMLANNHQLSLADDELQMRRQVLIQLLQATSEEEAHLREHSLGGVSKVIHHAKHCREADASLHWSMIRAMVMGEDDMMQPP